MNFGDILDEWDKETAKPYGKKRMVDSSRRDNSRRDDNQQGDNQQGDNQQSESKRVNPMDMWLRRYGTEDKDSLEESASRAESSAERRRRLRSMRPDAIIDLHGLSRDDAWRRLESFFADSLRRGLEKILIVHGKGTHSSDDPVLGPMVRVFLEQNPHAGESGHSSRESGGTGSTWVIIK